MGVEDSESDDSFQGEPEVSEVLHLRTPTRMLLGVTCLMGVVVIWVGSSVFIQYIFEDRDFSKPFFMTYFNTSLFCIYLLGFLFKSSWKVDPDGSLKKSVSKWWSRGSQTVPFTDKSDSELSEEIDCEGQVLMESESEGVLIHPKKVVFMSLKFCIVWFLANYTFNVSVLLTSVSSNTIIVSTSGLFTLVIGFVAGIDDVSFTKVIAAIVSFGGVVMVVLHDYDTDGGGVRVNCTMEANSSALRRDTSQFSKFSKFSQFEPQVFPTHTYMGTRQESDRASATTLWGDVLALVSAISYGFYAVLLKKLIPDENVVSMPMFFGFVGVWNLILLWPIGVLLSLTGVEPWEWPDLATFGLLLVQGLIGTVLSDYLWFTSLLLTSPLIATLGLSLTIPLAMMVDIWWVCKPLTVLGCLGGAMVAFGFVVVTADEKLRAFCKKMIGYDLYIGRGMCRPPHTQVTDVVY